MPSLSNFVETSFEGSRTATVSNAGCGERATAAVEGNEGEIKWDE